MKFDGHFRGYSDQPKRDRHGRIVGTQGHEWCERTNCSPGSDDAYAERAADSRAERARRTQWAEGIVGLLGLRLAHENVEFDEDEQARLKASLEGTSSLELAGVYGYLRQEAELDAQMPEGCDVGCALGDALTGVKASAELWIGDPAHNWLDRIGLFPPAKVLKTPSWISKAIRGLDRGSDAARGSLVPGRAVGSADARGGAYVLRDSQTGEVVRTGRTKDLLRRRGEHRRDALLRDYEFEAVYRTDSYAEQRGLEQILHNTYQPGLNRTNPIGIRNPKGESYLESAYGFLRRYGPRP